MRSAIRPVALLVACACLLRPVDAAAGAPADPRAVVAQLVGPLMQRYRIPGMAVGLVLHGQRHVYVFGVASTETGQKITDRTLFEIGSVSKTFTATLASYAVATGRLSLSDSATRWLPSLRGSAFDQVSVQDLGTHTAGGLPLQVPDGIETDAQLMAYFRRWTPTYPPGTHRTYGNPGIGMLGMIAANSLGGEFGTLMQRVLFPSLGLAHTYLDVPSTEQQNYAQGYTATGRPIRMIPGVAGPEAYGIRTTAGDLLRVVEANMGLIPLDPAWQRAITETHTGYDRVGAMIQDLVWEQYRRPVTLADLQQGNSDRVLLQPNPVSRLGPPLPPQDDVVIDKTGSTNGFSTYVLFVPGRRLGIVLLANTSYPIEARVAAAWSLMQRLSD